jgi:hypothetical protein
MHKFESFTFASVVFLLTVPTLLGCASAIRHRARLVIPAAAITHVKVLGDLSQCRTTAAANVAECQGRFEVKYSYTQVQQEKTKP